LGRGGDPSSDYFNTVRLGSKAKDLGYSSLVDLFQEEVALSPCELQPGIREVKELFRYRIVQLPSGVIVNETLAQRLGLEGEPISRKVDVYGCTV